jgi:hypothetical protein
MASLVNGPEREQAPPFRPAREPTMRRLSARTRRFPDEPASTSSGVSVHVQQHQSAPTAVGRAHPAQAV